MVTERGAMARYASLSYLLFWLLLCATGWVFSHSESPDPRLLSNTSLIRAAISANRRRRLRVIA